MIKKYALFVLHATSVALLTSSTFLCARVAKITPEVYENGSRIRTSCVNRPLIKEQEVTQDKAGDCSSVCAQLTCVVRKIVSVKHNHPDASSMQSK